MGKITHLDRYLHNAVRAIQHDPEEAGKRLVRLAKQEGYEMISHIFPSLMDAYGDDFRVWKVIVLLMQPDWQWRMTGDPNRAVFGVMYEGSFEATGFYYLGQLEDGDLHIIPRSSFQDAYTQEIEDPRYNYKDTRVMIYRKKSRHYLIEAGRIVDLVNKGYDKASLVLTKGKGYLRRLKAYTVLSEHKNVGEAREAKLAHKHV